jgi:hypothetical protein
MIVILERVERDLDVLRVSRKAIDVPAALVCKPLEHLRLTACHILHLA